MNQSHLGVGSDPGVLVSSFRIGVCKYLVHFSRPILGARTQLFNQMEPSPCWFPRRCPRTEASEWWSWDRYLGAYSQGRILLHNCYSSSI